MERYDYLEAVKNDIKDYIKYDMDSAHYDDSREDLEEFLYDELFVSDSVTGNASGSYYCNAWKAEEALTHNWDLLAEALEEFGESGVDVLKRGAEAMDCTIRCYVLGQAIAAALDEIEEELEEA